MLIQICHYTENMQTKLDAYSKITIDLFTASYYLLRKLKMHVDPR